MTKSDKATLFVAIVGIIISLLAWLFPINADLRNPFTYAQHERQLASQLEEVHTASTNVLLQEIEDNYEPLITELSFISFLNQVKLSGSDPGKLEYIIENRRLLKSKISFAEFITVVDTLGADRNKYAAAKQLRNYAEFPTEAELEIYASLFFSDINKRKALELIYKK